MNNYDPLTVLKIRLWSFREPFLPSLVRPLGLRRINICQWYVSVTFGFCWEFLASSELIEMTKSLYLPATEHFLAGIIPCRYKAKPAFNSVPGIPVMPAKNCFNAWGSCHSVSELEVGGTGYRSCGIALESSRLDSVVLRSFKILDWYQQSAGRVSVHIFNP